MMYLQGAAQLDADRARTGQAGAGGSPEHEGQRQRGTVDLSVAVFPLADQAHRMTDRGQWLEKTPASLICLAVTR